MSTTFAVLSGIAAAFFSCILAVGLLAYGIVSGGLLEGAGERHQYKACEIFVKGEATAEQADKLGQFLIDVGYFSDESRFSVQLDNDGKQTIVRFVVNKLGWTDKELEVEYRRLKLLMEIQVFENQEIRFELVDSDLQFKKLIQDSNAS